MRVAVDPDVEFTGKYEQAGRVGGYLLGRFYSAVQDLLQPSLGNADVVLEVGCGAGFSTQRLRGWLPPRVTYLGSDIGETLLQKASVRNADTTFIRQSAYSLALPDKSVDATVMLEVLEHLDDPAKAL